MVIWTKCLALIREQLPPKTFRTWFEPIRPLKYKNHVLTIQVGSNYVYEYLEEHFIGILKSSLQSVIGPKAKLEYSVVVESQPKKPVAVTFPSDQERKAGVNVIDAVKGGVSGLHNPFEPVVSKIQIHSQLNPAYTLESFVEGACNQLARSAGLAIAGNPGKTAFNPLLIYGGSGLGKTHLAQAIGHKVKEDFPEKVVLYVSTNLFQTQFTEAVRKNEINDFLHFYQLIDVLILDDIHELAGKTGTQNTLFHIFNHLQQLGKQLILTCDKAPAELSGIEERLLSRFRWGLSAEIKAPDYETRREIVKYKAQKDGLQFSKEVIDDICKYADSNVRELEGAMISLLAQATFNKKDLTTDLVREILGKMVTRQPEEQLTVDRIQKVLCNYFHVTPELLHSKNRKREIVQARQLAMYFCKNHTNASLASIGKQIGNRDHATVIYACKAVSDLLDTDKSFRMQVEEIHTLLYSRK